MSAVALHSNAAATTAARGYRLAAVDGLRGLAIAAVILQHVLTGMLAPDALTLRVYGVAVSASPLLTNGWTGVNLFFILSGFVLFLPYAGDNGGMRTADDRTRFYRRRCRRLLPLFYIAVIAAWVLALVDANAADLGELLWVLSFGYVFNAHYFGPSFNIALWSIGLEIAFSAMFPLLVAGLRRWGIARFVAAILIVALAARLVGIWRSPALQGPTFNSDGIFCRIDEFVLGMAMARAVVRGLLPRRTALYALGGLALVVLAWIGFDLVLRGIIAPLNRAWLVDMLDAGLIGILVAALAPGSRLAAALAWRPLQVVGMMCYSLYLWHWPLLRWLAPDRAAATLPQVAASLALFLAVTLAISGLTYRFIEFRRVRDWRSLFLLPPRDGHQVAEAAALIDRTA